MDVSSNFEMFENFSEQNNTLQNDLDNISIENSTLSNIPIKSKSLTSEFSTIKEVKNIMKNIKIAYPNKDEIPLIKIKDKILLESGEKIENYINNLIEFNDNKFNKCAICRKYQNKYFCQNCQKNICYFGHKNCMSNNHTLIGLSIMRNKIFNYIEIIKSIFHERFILSEKSEDDNSVKIIKKINNCNFFGEIGMTGGIEENLIDYTSDIKLIEAIIEKKYINYFH